MLRISTRRDMLRHTATRIVVAVSLTVAMLLIMLVLAFGIDPNATVDVGAVMTVGVVMGAIIAAVLAGALTYRSAGVMRELTIARAELLQLSRTDQLTGLHNRRFYDEAATESLKSAEKAAKTASVLLCDIDHFKAINDRFGHEVGDRVLVEIGAVLDAFAKQNDLLVARHGGEEFAALVIGMPDDRLGQLAESLRCACAARQIPGAGFASPITVSIGLASTQHNYSLAGLMRAADGALYRAKNAGRDRVILASDRPEPLAA